MITDKPGGWCLKVLYGATALALLIAVEGCGESLPEKQFKGTLRKLHELIDLNDPVSREPGSAADFTARNNYRLERYRLMKSRLESADHDEIDRPLILVGVFYMWSPDSEFFEPQKPLVRLDVEIIAPRAQQWDVFVEGPNGNRIAQVSLAMDNDDPNRREHFIFFGFSKVNTDEPLPPTPVLNVPWDALLGGLRIGVCDPVTGVESDTIEPFVGNAVREFARAD